MHCHCDHAQYIVDTGILSDMVLKWFNDTGQYKMFLIKSIISAILIYFMYHHCDDTQYFVDTAIISDMVLLCLDDSGLY
jgi:hypothetical protein